MKLWIKILSGAIPGSIILVLSILFLIRLRRRRQPDPEDSSVTKSRKEGFQAGVAKLHLSYKSGSKNNTPFHHLDHHHHHPILQQPAQFNWADNPRLVAEAVENGWSRFAFPGYSSGHRSTMPMWGLCVVCDGGRQPEEAEINWEVPFGSSEFMQTVRINPGSKSSSSSSDGDQSLCFSVGMGLPLPGPPLEGSSFPQEAYFEITILNLPQQQRVSRSSKRAKEGDRAKLIQGNSVESNFDSVQEINKSTNEDEGKHHSLVISLGLTGGEFAPNKAMPGTYPGSISFNSDGSVCLDGMKLVFESKKTEWAGVNKVIGCGFNPGKKKVYFTVDSELVHVIRCNSDVFKNPLYPVLAADGDVLVLINLGQSAFRYAPANLERTPNPCFLRPSAKDTASAVIGYEDSRELFSIGRMDSHWIDATKKNKSHGSIHNHSSSKNSNSIYNDGSIIMDVSEESDLFEIPLHS